ncbi:MAG TPA: class I SAM-dependent methyltransferase [Pseudonocardiaceae bacterium]|jgi:SAM-dependent methyltransferase|nr:class I SAM-dependent methyltransferase [Pseudonocardiaceae bacterium]
MDDYLAINKANWDERAPAHVASPGYEVERFVTDPTFLSKVVQFDVPRLGDLTGLRGVHLQCHIGTDTLSLARLGARMSGLDFSAASVAEARKLAERTNTPIDYHVAPVYDAVEVLGAQAYDLVFTGIGALSWLPDIRRWADVVGGLLRPGGRLFIREGHPMLWTLDEHVNPAVLRYPYFEHVDPVVDDYDETYVESDAKLTATTTHSWNHGMAEIITALMDAGLRLTQFVEHNSVPWNAIPGQMSQTEDDDLKEWRLTTEPNRLAASYTIQAVKD